PAPRTTTPASLRRVRSRPAIESQLFIRVFPFCTAGVEPDFGQVPTPRRERTVRVLDRNDSHRFWNRATSVSFTDRAGLGVGIEQRPYHRCDRVFAESSVRNRFEV